MAGVACRMRDGYSLWLIHAAKCESQRSVKGLQTREVDVLMYPPLYFTHGATSCRQRQGHERKRAFIISGGRRPARGGGSFLRTYLPTPGGA